MKWIKLCAVFIYLIIISVTGYYVLNINFFVEAAMMLPICAYLVLFIHEISHFCFLALFKIHITELCIGLFKLSMGGKHIEFQFENYKLYSGYCSFKIQSNKMGKIVVALMSGGISGVIISAISLILLLTNVADETKPFFFSLFFAGLYSLYTTLLRKTGADRIAIIKLLKGK